MNDHNYTILLLTVPFFNTLTRVHNLANGYENLYTFIVNHLFELINCFFFSNDQILISMIFLQIVNQDFLVDHAILRVLWGILVKIVAASVFQNAL